MPNSTDPAAVKETARAQLLAFAKRENDWAEANYKSDLGRYLADRDIRASLKLPVAPVPYPAQKVEYVMVDDDSSVGYRVDVKLGPALVHAPYEEPEAAAPPPPNVPDFGPPVGDGSGRILVGVKDTVPAGGTVIHPSGQRYQKFVIPSPFGGEWRWYLPLP